MNQAYISGIGGVLENARHEVGLTLSQASAALHIRAHYLKALETGELSILPGAAYAKGYLLSYASFLRLDKDEILRRFERVEDDLPKKGLFFPQVFSNEKKPSNSAVWGGLLAAFVVYLLWFFAFRPEISSVSIIETPPITAAIYNEYSAPISLLNLSCAWDKPDIYPACYHPDMGMNINSSLLPLNRNVVSVMELRINH